MLKRVCFMWCAAALLFSCSDETTDEPLNLKGEIKGNVYLRSEFGWAEPDPSGVTISLEGSSGKVQAITDIDGKYSLPNIPFGTYNLIGEKPGYSKTKLTGIKVAGGGQPTYQSISLTRPSTSKFENVTLSLSTGITNMINVTGTLTHNDPSTFPYVQVVAFLSTSPDVSSENHMQSTSYVTNLASGNSLTWYILTDVNKFPKGSKVYIKFYGCSSGLTGVFNYEKARTEYLGLSESPSNTVSIVL